jgi:hypothetical protein
MTIGDIVEKNKKKEEENKMVIDKEAIREAYLRGLEKDPQFLEIVIKEVKKEIKANDTITGLMNLTPEERDREMIKRNAIISSLKKLFSRFL